MIQYYRISYIFQSKMVEGDAIVKKSKVPKTYFDAKEAPAISIKDYIFHLICSLKTHPATLILMVIYIERFVQSLSDYLCGSGQSLPFFLTMSNAHRIVLTALIIAHKYSMDISYPFSVLSKIVGVSISELKILEYEFLFFLKYELFVSEDLYGKFEETLNQWPGITHEQILLEQEKFRAKLAFQAICESTKEETKEIEEEEEGKIEKSVYGGNSECKTNAEEDSKIDTIDFTRDQPNPASRHEKPFVDLAPPSSVENLETINHFYQHDGEGYDSESYYPDTEMTIVNEDDLGVDEFPDDVVIWNNNINSSPPPNFYSI